MNKPLPLRLIGLFVLCLTAFFVLFTTWACYDDEGYILWTLIHHQQGHVLYEEVFTQYGPAFYVLDASLRNLLPFAYTTDGQRWETLLFWILSTFILLRSFDRLSCDRKDRDGWAAPGGLAMGLFAAVALFWHQERLALEPGHPQIWCSLLVCTCLLVLAARFSTPLPRTSRWFPWLLGAMAGTLIMIKPNVGCYLLVALPAGYLWTASRECRWIVISETVYTACLVVFPWILMWRQLQSVHGVLLPVLISTTILALKIGIEIHLRPSLRCGPGNRFGLRPIMESLIAILTGAFAAIASLVLWSFEQGVSPTVLQRGLFGQHGSLLSFYFHPVIRTSIGWLVLTVIAVAVLIVIARRIGSNGRRGAWMVPTRGQWRIVFVTLGPLLVAVDVFDGLFLLVHGLLPRGNSEVLLAISPIVIFGWLALRSTGLFDGRDPVGAHQRAMILVSIAAIAATQPLIAYPVPGTQLSLGTLPLVLLLLDGFRIAWNELDLAGRNFETKGLLPVVCACGFIPMIVIGYRYATRESLGLPGANLLRLADEDRIGLQESVSRVRHADVDSLAFRWHNRPSWYLWTQLQPPHCQLPPSWTYLLSEDQQRAQLANYQRFDRILIVDEEYDPGIEPPKSPLHSAWGSATIEGKRGREFTFLIWHPK